MVNPRHKKALFYLELCYRLMKMNKENLAKESIKEADQYLAEDEFAKAIALYKIALLLMPDNQEAKVKILQAQEKEALANQSLELMLHLEAAREYHNKKDYFNAVQEWSKALMIQPENEEAKEGLKTDKALLEQQLLQEKINELISKGIDLFLEKKYNDAETVFLEVIRLDYQNKVALEYLQKIKEMKDLLNQKSISEAEAEKHFQLGVKYFNLAQYQEALQEFDLTLEIIPDHSQALYYKEKTLLMIKKMQEKEEADRNEQIQKLLQEGIDLYQLGEYPSSIMTFKKVLELDPENVYAKEYLKLAEQALQLQKEAVLDPHSPYYPIIKNLEIKGKEYLDKKEYDVALKYFNEIKDLFPLNQLANQYILKITYRTEPERVKKIVDSHYQAGIRYYQNKDYLRALYELELVNSIEPNYPELQKYLAWAKKPPGLYDKEIAQSFNKGLYYFSQKKYEEAIKEWKRSIELDKSPLSNKYLAKSLLNITKAEYRMKAEKGELTLTQIETQSQEKSKKVNKHYYMGLAYYTGGDYQKALSEWQEVLRIEPNHSLTLKNVAKLKNLMSH